MLDIVTDETYYANFFKEAYNLESNIEIKFSLSDDWESIKFSKFYYMMKEATRGRKLFLFDIFTDFEDLYNDKAGKYFFILKGYGFDNEYKFFVRDLSEKEKRLILTIAHILKTDYIKKIIKLIHHEIYCSLTYPEHAIL